MSLRLRVRRVFRRVVRGLLLAAAVVSATIVVGASAIDVGRWYERHFDWRDHEYDKLTALHAGYSRRKFEEALGLPVFDRMSRDGRLREETFKRRDHWVQIVSDHTGTVELYAVTSCSLRFQPTFHTPGAETVRLSSSHFSDVERQESQIDFNAYMGTAPVHFLELLSGGNTTLYKTFVWGVNDACNNAVASDDSLFRRRILPSHSPIRYRGELTYAPPWVRRLRRAIVVNTYAETSATFWLERLPQPFQVGVDRTLSRTIG